MKRAVGITSLLLLVALATSCVALRSTMQAIAAGEAQSVSASKSPPVPPKSGEPESFRFLLLSLHQDVR
jgi:hypothetical protein